MYSIVSSSLETGIATREKQLPFRFSTTDETGKGDKSALDTTVTPLGELGRCFGVHPTVKKLKQSAITQTFSNEVFILIESYVESETTQRIKLVLIHDGVDQIFDATLNEPDVFYQEFLGPLFANGHPELDSLRVAVTNSGDACRAEIRLKFKSLEFLYQVEAFLRNEHALLTFAEPTE